jgi:hypothetical protein
LVALVEAKNWAKTKQFLKNVVPLQWPLFVLKIFPACHKAFKHELTFLTAATLY